MCDSSPTAGIDLLGDGLGLLEGVTVTDGVGDADTDDVREGDGESSISVLLLLSSFGSLSIIPSPSSTGEGRGDVEGLLEGDVVIDGDGFTADPASRSPSSDGAGVGSEQSRVSRAIICASIASSSGDIVGSGSSSSSTLSSTTSIT